jgi:hypothetical protein
LGLAEVGDLLALQLINVQKFNRIPNAQFCTSAPILANPSYVYILLNLVIQNEYKKMKEQSKNKIVKPLKQKACLTRLSLALIFPKAVQFGKQKSLC